MDNVFTVYFILCGIVAAVAMFTESIPLTVVAVIMLLIWGYIIYFGGDGQIEDFFRKRKNRRNK